MSATLVGHGIVPLGRILRADQAGLYRDAAEAMTAAKAAADEMRTAAASDAAAAHAQRIAELERDARQNAARILAETTAAAQQSLAGLRREIAEAIAEGVAKVVGGIDLAEAVARTAQRALAELVERRAVVVHVNPAAQAATRARLAAWGDGARVVGDPALATDACVIETPMGFVRAGLAKQIAALRAALYAAADRDV